MKYFSEAYIDGRKFKENGKTYLVIEVELVDLMSGKLIHLRTKEPIAWTNFKRIGREMLEKAGYFVYESYKKFTQYAPAEGDVNICTKIEADRFLSREVPEVNFFDVENLTFA